MKLCACCFEGVPPLTREGKPYTLLMMDEWKEPSERVLLTGISGTGKSTVLACIQDTFDAIVLGRRASLRGDVALLVRGLIPQKDALLVRGRSAAFLKRMRAQFPQAAAIGEAGGKRVGDASLWGSAPPNTLLCDVYGAHSMTIRETKAELQALYREDGERCRELLSSLALFLVGKRVQMEAGAPYVSLEDGGRHSLGGLSAGELRALTLLIRIARGLRPGGVLLLDEPEMHLHPAQLLGFLEILERLVLDGGGQVILSSHAPQVWNRYRSLGLCVELGGGHERI